MGAQAALPDAIAIANLSGSVESNVHFHRLD